ncbi:MAG: hypothetical protein ACP5JB_04535 [candidate division WOR-3 bacterium]|jgi:hypothetical protein
MKMMKILFTGIGAGIIMLNCSDAPLISRAANRVVLVELFSTPLDE